MVLFKAFYGLVKGKFGKKVPLKVQHVITYRCNYHCDYCDFYTKKSKELNTEQIKKIMSDFANAGTVSWTFTGGEPLIRKDIKELVLHAKSLKLHVALNTNGALVKENLDWLHHINQLSISLDGLEKVNDITRGKGSFKTVIEAVRLLKKKNVEPFIISVLNKENLRNNCEGLKKLLELTCRLNIKIMFIPIHKGNLGTNQIDLTNITPDELVKATTILKEYKKKHKPKLVMSYSALDYFISEEKYLECYAGHLFCTIFPDGSVGHCLFKEKQALKDSPLISFYNLPKIKNCSCNLNCYVEYNNLLSLNFRNILEFLLQYL